MRELPNRGEALVYQRLSSHEQVKQRIYAVQAQDDLVDLARKDGYPADHISVEDRVVGISGTEGKRIISIQGSHFSTTASSVGFRLGTLQLIGSPPLVSAREHRYSGSLFVAISVDARAYPQNCSWECKVDERRSGDPLVAHDVAEVADVLPPSARK